MLKRIILFMFLLCNIKLVLAENILYVAVSQNVGDMNPQGYQNQLYAQNMIYEGLVKTDRNGKIVPFLANSWEIKDQGKTYIFHLRKNVTFSNGEKFDSYAVEKNFKSILLNRAKHSWSALVMLIDYVKVIDEYTIALCLKQPYLATLNELSLIRPFRFLAPSMFPNDLDLLKNKPKGQIGTGPYMITDTKMGISDTFSKNPNYWDKQRYNGIYFDKIITKVIIDSNSKLIALRTNQIDLIYGSNEIPIEIFKDIAKSNKFQSFISPPIFTTTLVLNPYNRFLESKDFREIIALAIDKEKIVKHVYYGYQNVAPYLFSPNMPYSTPKNYKTTKYNKKLAKDKLQRLGYTYKDDGYLYKDEKKITLNINFIANNPTQKAIAEILQAQLKDIGIFLQLIPNEISIYQNKRLKGNFDICFSQTWGIPYEPFTFLNSMRNEGHIDYIAQKPLKQKPLIDKAIQDIIQSAYDLQASNVDYKNDKKEKELSNKMENLLDMIYETQIYIPLTYDTNKVVSRSGIKGIAPDIHAFEIPFWEFYE